ncbi:MAG: type IV secretory system conjugative DNA transfer family protein [Bacteriovorax sp.]|jgi:type IV secretory pathway TraG/TraD family ATPase VirD4|nr:type IV secretory system conjugative DNA transfer family protein [Bacteriovorax sp.]
MAQDKNKKNDNASNEMAGELGKMLIIAFAAVAAWIAIIALSFSASLAAMGERYRDHGYNEWEILKSKTFRAVGILPFVLILAYVSAQYFPKNISIKNYLSARSLRDNPKTETEFRELVEDAKSKIGSSQDEVRSLGYSIQSNVEDAQRINRDLDRARTVEEKSELEESYKRTEKEWNENKIALFEAKKSIPKWKDKLIVARNDLEAFRKGQPTTFDRPKSTGTRDLVGTETENSNTGNFMWYGFLLVLLSLPLSYPMIYFSRSDRKELKNFQTFSKWLDRVSDKISYLGLIPFRFLATLIGSTINREEKTNKPSSVMQVGYERNAFLTDRNLNYHTQIIGGSGAGKTNLLKVMLEDRIVKGHAIIFFDFKGEVDLIDWMAGATEYYGRRDDLAMISMADPKTSYAYNPISLGTETEISSQIMNAFTWSESFYKNSAENALLIILKALCYQRDMTHKTFHLGDLYKFLTDPSFRMDIVSAVSQLNYPDMFRADLKRICEELSTNKKENYLSLITQISKILNSSAGEIVAHKIGTDAEFNLREAMSSGKITYFMMNNLKLKETAAIMGKMILQDLMKTVGNIYDDRTYQRNPVALIIDEFASFATPDFGEFIEKARGAGISIVVTYQSRKSLDHIEQSLALKMNENTANKVVFQVQDSEDVEWFCSLLGTKKTTKETHQAEDGFFGDTKTGMKSVREVEEYVIHPNEIKKLKRGQALLYCSKVDPHHVIMNIKRANEFEGRYERKFKNEKIAKSEDVNVSVLEQGNNNDMEFDDLI